MFSLRNEAQNGKRYKKGASNDGCNKKDTLQAPAALVKASVSTAPSKKTTTISGASLEQYQDYEDYDK